MTTEIHPYCKNVIDKTHEKKSTQEIITYIFRTYPSNLFLLYIYTCFTRIGSYDAHIFITCFFLPNNTL